MSVAAIARGDRNFPVPIKSLDLKSTPLIMSFFNAFINAFYLPVFASILIMPSTAPNESDYLQYISRLNWRFFEIVRLQEIPVMFDRQVLLEWGISDALFIDGKEVSTGPPPSYESIYKLIAKRLRKL